MTEQELKLHVPEHSRGPVKKAVQAGQSSQTLLKALYFDTPDRELARAKIAIRLRLEGDKWVQTLKMPGANSISKLEINHDRPNPILDLSLYANSPAAPVLTQLQNNLGVRYETDITRTKQHIHTDNGIVEVAYDEGAIRSGELELPVNELEFELISGETAAIFELGLEWLQKYALILDVRSKSHRGDALASASLNIAENKESAIAAEVVAQEIKRFWSPIKATPYKINASETATGALIEASNSCLEQIALNAGYLAEIDTYNVLETANPEHTHQLRIGMRRLSSNWKLFSDLAHLPNEELVLAFKGLFAHFGSTRDIDVMLETVVPELNEAGMPELHFERSEDDDRSATETARSIEFQTWLVKMLAWTVLTDKHKPLETPETAEHSSTIEQTPEVDSAINPQIIPLPAVNQTNRQVLRKTLEQRLNKWHKSIVYHWRTNDKNEIEHYHDLRKKIKRMRYALNVYEAVNSNNKLGSYIKSLSSAQEKFGVLNDLSTAHAFFTTLKDEQPGVAWFALGWLQARMSDLKFEADLRLEKVPKKITF